MKEIEKKYQDFLEREKNYSRAKTINWLTSQFERLDALGFKMNSSFKMTPQKVAGFWEEELKEAIIDYGFDEARNAFTEYVRTHEYGFPTVKQILSYFEGIPSPRDLKAFSDREKDLDEQESRLSEALTKKLESDKQIVLSLPIEKRYDWIHEHYPSYEDDFVRKMGIDIKGD